MVFSYLKHHDFGHVMCKEPTWQPYWMYSVHVCVDRLICD